MTRRVTFRFYRTVVALFCFVLFSSALSHARTPREREKSGTAPSPFLPTPPLIFLLTLNNSYIERKRERERHSDLMHPRRCRILFKINYFQ